MLTWETFIRAWMDGCNDNNPDKLAPFLADDFKWATSTSDSHTGAKPEDGLDRARTLELVKTGPFANGANESTIFESEDVLVGTHTITVSGQPCRVMGVAKVRDDKVYEYHHSRVEL
jgi:hypothetical protein